MEMYSGNGSESVYSIKRKRTSQTDRNSQRIPDLVYDSRGASDKFLRYKSVSCENLKPLESFGRISSQRGSISKLYKSRIMPSQFMSTPAEVLNKLTNDLYNPRKAKDNFPGLILEKESYSRPSLATEPQPTRKKISKNEPMLSHTHLENSCNKMLEENKKSQRILKVAEKFLNKRALLAKIALKATVYEEKEKYEDFHLKLKAAHSQLVKKDRIQPKKQKSSHFKSVSEIF